DGVFTKSGRCPHYVLASQFFAASLLRYHRRDKERRRASESVDAIADDAKKALRIIARRLDRVGVSRDDMVSYLFDDGDDPYRWLHPLLHAERELAKFVRAAEERPKVAEQPRRGGSVRPLAEVVVRLWRELTGSYPRREDRNASILLDALYESLV